MTNSMEIGELCYLVNKNNTPTVFTFIKDTHLKFLACSENLAYSAALESQEQIRGKTDLELCWKNKADFYQKTDSLILNNSYEYINALEKQQQTNKLATILITKIPIFDRNDKCVGISGSYVDVTDYYVIKKSGRFENNNSRYYLGQDLENEYLTKREISVLRLILLGYSSKRIAANLDLSPRTIEGYIEVIKLKLQCPSKAELVLFAFKYGLVHLLSDILENMSE